ncbi:RNA polymerase sigma factor [Variovorax sp. MHTC-1]|uniref:RNA polymerase sigma factor n=1 Tax=Variovorax sp. MHTC-1 TaxID=2495593 RepID=UPI000F894252|nr:RNA polymerase sigma factor [Variovorax sp. MHTC-1]RST53046.1 RNA polymerase sigma factor [Variovorax sp. MHTC-1]
MHDLVQELVKHYRDLRKQLTWELRDPEHAADIAQSSFERVYTHALGLKGSARGSEDLSLKIDSPRALLFRVARNLCIDAARHRQVVQEWARDRSSTDVATSAPSSEYLISQRQILERVVQTLEKLPPRRREVFLLFRAYGYTHAEIAARLGITEMAVAKHLVRAVLDCSRTLAELRTQIVEPQLPSMRSAFVSSLAEESC